ncbi:hypothetical protein ACWEQK_12630 [Streptomyces parvulus]
MVERPPVGVIAYGGGREGPATFCSLATNGRNGSNAQVGTGGSRCAHGRALVSCGGTEGTASGGGKSDSTSDSALAAESSKAPAESGDVKITKAGVEDHQVWGDGAYVVHYEITNTGADAANYFAEIRLVDKDGDHLGQTGVTGDR